MRSNILAFVFGTAFLQQQAQLPDLPWLWLTALLGPVVLYCVKKISAHRRANLSSILGKLTFAIIFSVMGFCWAGLSAHYRLADTLSAEWEGRDVQLTGVISSLVQPTQYGVRLKFDVEQVRTAGPHIPRHIQLNFYQSKRSNSVENELLNARPGERWLVTVRLKRPHADANPHVFDYEAWLLQSKIRAVGYIRAEPSNRRLDNLVYRPDYLIQRAREHIAKRMDGILRDRPYKGILQALVIGDQSGITREQWQLFTHTGVNHLMSISGLHVTMFASMTFALIYFLWRNIEWLSLRVSARRVASATGLLAACCYALLAGLSIPTQRTLYMLAAVALAIWLNRLNSASAILCVALMTVVVIDPWAALAPGFWLSFGAVALIVFVSTGRTGKTNKLIEAAEIQWAITLGLAPLLLLLFHQLSIVAPVANIFAIPAISLVVIPITLLGSMLSFDTALIWAHHLMEACIYALRWLSQFPYTLWEQHTPPLWAIILGVISILWMLLPSGLPARWLGIVGLAPMFLITPPEPQPGELWLTALDVGQGLAVVLRTTNHTLLYDSGPQFSKEADSGNRLIIPYLRGEGIKRLDGMIVTHDDKDHSGGAASVMSGITTHWLLSSLPDNHSLLQAAIIKRRCFAGQSWTWDEVKFEVLHPHFDSYLNTSLKDNERGCVVKVTSRYGSVLLPTDIENKSERQLVNNFSQLLRATVLVAPHHGSKTSSTPEFVTSVNPKAVVFSVGHRNRFGHPKQEVLERYQDAGSLIFRSDRDGALDVRFRNDGVTIKSYRKTHRRYWHGV